MNGEELYLIGELNGCLGELKALINTKNEGQRRVQRALSTYDGDGKLFEALTLFRLKSLFDEYGIETRICHSDGSTSTGFVLILQLRLMACFIMRGAINQPVLRSTPDNKPSKKALADARSSRRPKTGPSRCFNVSSSCCQATTDPDQPETDIKFPPIKHRN